MYLLQLTEHEAGIIVYGENTVGVWNWGLCDDDQIPALSPIREQMAWPEEAGVFDDVKSYRFSDVRNEIPGAIWIEDGEAKTDLDIVYDANGDLPRLFLEKLTPADYEGTAYVLKDGRKILALDMWN